MRGRERGREKEREREREGKRERGRSISPYFFLSFRRFAV
jgi:hypothetical protein